MKYRTLSLIPLMIAALSGCTTVGPDYVAPDLSILSEHITDGGITTAAYQQQPDNVPLAIRDDGTMIPFTYERDPEVTGWYRWTVDGGSGGGRT